jgi:hypothetical protein
MNPRRNIPARSAVSAFSESSDGLGRWVCLKPPSHSQSRWTVRNAHLSLTSATRPLLGGPPGRSDQCVHVPHSSTTLQQLPGAGLFWAISSTRKTHPSGTATRPSRATSAFNPLYMGSGLVQTLLSGMLGRSTFAHAPVLLRPSTPDRNLWFRGSYRLRDWYRAKTPRLARTSTDTDYFASAGVEVAGPMPTISSTHSSSFAPS